jgi:hypothetical protein
LCTWCDSPLQDPAFDPDHVFPEWLGGSRELTVPSCRPCQKILSTIEVSVARRSLLSLFRLQFGPSRDRKDPTSGLVEADYVLARDPQGGWGERAVRAGDQVPVVLPSLQIDLAAGRVAKMGACAEDVTRLLVALVSLRTGVDAQGTAELGTSLIFEHDRADDPSFWPRVFLDLRGHLRIRARSEKEAISLGQSVFALLDEPRLWDHAGWEMCEMQAGAEHVVRITEDFESTARLLSKIVYALLSRRLSRDDLIEFQSLRRFVMAGRVPGTDCPTVEQLLLPGHSPSPRAHFVAVKYEKTRVVGLVSLYGGLWRVDASSRTGAAAAQLPVVAECRFDRSFTRILDGDEAQTALEELQALEREAGQNHESRGVAGPKPLS